jgi:hypothetical protein
MWNLFVLLAGAFAPTPPTPPPAPSGPPPTCSADGGVLFEIDHKVDMRSVEEIAVETSELKLYAGGKWTFQSSSKRTASGCLSRDQMKAISADLARATWTSKVAQAACAAISAGYTEYAAHGNVVWTQHMCQLEYLDDASRHSLDDIEKILLTVSAEHKVPCCKK